MYRNLYLNEKKDFEKDWGIKDQIRRAVVSISNNIAEGFEYNNNNYFLKYLKIAKASCGEVRNIIIILYAINYITIEEKEYFYNQSNTISNKLGSPIKYLQNNKIEQSKK